MWQVQWRHQVHDWKEALHLLADFPEIHQPSHPPGHFSFLPGDSSPTRTHLFSLGPRLREFTKTTSYKNLWNLKKKEKKKKKINIISQNQLFLFYVILPHLMKKFHFYLHNIKKTLQIFIVRQQDRFTGCFHGLKRGVDSYCKAAITPSTLLLGSKSSGSLALLVSSTELQAV